MPRDEDARARRHTFSHSEHDHRHSQRHGGAAHAPGGRANRAQEFGLCVEKKIVGELPTDAEEQVFEPVALRHGGVAIDLFD